MTRSALIAALGAFSLAACGGGESADNAPDEVPGQSVNADGINIGGDASGTTGSTTGDAGGPLNVAGDGEGDAREANMANAQ
jgi:hypothetical protein